MQLSLFNWLRNTSGLKAVQDNDLVGYLKSLGVYDDVLNGKITCVFCGEKINLDNLQALFPKDDKVAMVCSKIICLDKIYAG
jgi:hypothetical protein